MSWATVDKGGRPDAGPRFVRYLDPGEQILWTGAPPGGLLLRRKDLLLIPFSLLFVGFSLFWTAGVSGALDSGGDGFVGIFLVVGLAFVGIGLFLAFGRFVVDAIQRRATAYAVTDRRALILRRGNLKSMPLEPGLQVSISGQGRGSIMFGPDPGLMAGLQGARGIGGWIGPGHPFIFERIGDVDRIHRLIREAQTRDRRR